MERERLEKHSVHPHTWRKWGTSFSARDRVTGADVELVEIQFPHCGCDASELEARAIEAMEDAAVVEVRGVARWLHVGRDAEGVYAVREPRKGTSLRELWTETARRAPHRIEFAWRDPGAMAEDAYGDRLGPWRVDDPVPDLVSRRRHQPRRVDEAPFDLPSTLGFIREIAVVLRTLHRSGCAHTNLQPRAVLVHDERITLADMGTGLAELRGSMYMGSGWSNYEASYFTPELCWSREPDASSDVFALGVLLWELLAYGGAFTRATCVDTMKAVLEDPLPPISSLRREVPRDIDQLIAAATQKEPGDRVSVDAFLETIPNRPIPIAKMLAVLDRPVSHDRLIAL